MKSNNKLTKLRSEKGILKGGFSTLTDKQLEKLKGGSGTTESNTNCFAICQNTIC